MIVLRWEELVDAGGPVAARLLLGWRKSQAVIDAGLDPHEADVIVTEDWATGDLHIMAVRH